MREFLQNISNIVSSKWNLNVNTASAESPRLFGTFATVAFVAVAGLLALYLQMADSSEAKTPPAAVDTIDMQIPPGLILHPVEIINYEYLDSIIGDFGQVNLYSVPLNKSEKPIKIASDVKIVRSTSGSGHYFALLNDTGSMKLLQTPGPYQVTIKNPKNQYGTEFETKRKNRIRYLSE